MSPVQHSIKVIYNRVRGIFKIFLWSIVAFGIQHCLTIMFVSCLTTLIKPEIMAHLSETINQIWIIFHRYYSVISICFLIPTFYSCLEYGREESLLFLIHLLSKPYSVVCFHCRHDPQLSEIQYSCSCFAVICQVINNSVRHSIRIVPLERHHSFIAHW